MNPPSVRVITIDSETRNQVITSYNKMSDVSDGYHTFEELYRYRMLYNAAFFNQLYTEHNNRDIPGGPPVKSKRHSDGELCFGGGWFVVTVDLPTGQISNHYEEKYWDLFKVLEVEKAPEWDGHSPKQAADRLEKYVSGDW